MRLSLLPCVFQSRDAFHCGEVKQTGSYNYLLYSAINKDRELFDIALFIFREEALQKYVEKQREKAHPKSEDDKIQVRFTTSRFAFRRKYN